MMKHFAFFLFLLILSGCGKGGAVFTGKITYEDGEPFTVGAVIFDNGKQTWFSPVKNGTYTIGGTKDFGKAVFGTYKVYIGNSGIDADMIRENPQFADFKDVKNLPIETVDTAFTRADTSGLTAEIKSGMKQAPDFKVGRPKSGPFAQKQ